MAEQRPRSWLQSGLLLAAGCVWGLFGLPTVSSLVWAYLAVVGVAGLLRGRGVGRGIVLPWDLALPLVVVLAGPLIWGLERRASDLWIHSQLEGLGTVYRDRGLGTGGVSVHPIVIRDDRPQVLWLRAEVEEGCTLRLGPSGAVISVLRVGPQLSRAVYDPREHGSASGHVELELACRSDFEPTGRSVRSVRTGPRPTQLVELPGGGAIGLSEETDELLWLDVQGSLRRVPTADAPMKVAVLGDSVVAVVHRFAPELHRFSLPDLEPLPAVALGPGLVDVAAGSGCLAAVARSPNRLHVQCPGVDRVLDLGFVPRRVFPGGSRERWYLEAETAPRLHRVEGDQIRVLAPIGRPSYAARLDAEGCLQLFVPDHRPRLDAGPNHHVEDQQIVLCGDRVARTEPTFIRKASGEVVGGVGPHAISRSGAVAYTGSDEIELPGVGRLPSPLPSPRSVAAIGGGRWAVASAVAGAIAVVRSGGEVDRRHELGVAEGPEQAQVRRGERAFYEGTRGGAACETCHVDADGDRSLHDIGHGYPRPTLSVRGVAGTAPYLRVASYPDLSGLEHFAATLLGGYSRSSETRAADLVAYVESLPAPEPVRRLDAEGWRAGYAAFLDAGCASCHAPPAFTDRAQYPQPLLFPEQPSGVLLDTPSLIGVASTPPYLYDGRAESLRSIFFEHDPAGRHGAFARLSPAARERLFDFLEAL